MEEEQAAVGDAMGPQAESEPDRQRQPVDAEQAPRLAFPVVGIGASAGGLEAVGEFLDAMPPESGMSFVLVQHLPPDRDSLMAEILARRTAMTVLEVEDGAAVEPDHLYVIRPGHRLTIRDGRLHLGPQLGTSRASNRPIDDFFKSLAEDQRERAIAVVMSGMGSNGTAGAQAIKAVGGLCIAQDPDSAQFPSMPRHLIEAGYADYILRPADLPEMLLAYAGHPYARGGREAAAGPTLERERQHLREILAVLRTRTGKDFSGYKKPTLLRRVQRRMGLARMEDPADYARAIRQNPAEVSALADDLLIHVTGFFRDPESWEALRRGVIAPLLRGRDAGIPVRAWVTACSSGEEAYSLAMMLIEEAEAAGVAPDIKVFATDLADRTLAQARAGVYPGGIESEIGPDRLSRFFAREDEVYRVRSGLRDRVVFAPQNILQDPPFSRLDIAACRNLLIYLEPEVQQRVLGLLHFGLREGGALFLGSSETVAGAEDLFEPVDKQARIFRRVGPTRHGAVGFPLPDALMPAAEAGGRAPAAGRMPRPRSGREGERPTLAELTRRTLLERHTPPAVTVNRDGRIAFYHGDTRPFLQQLTGEPTRELMLLARDGVRVAARAALLGAVARGERSTSSDGWLELEPGRRSRVTVVASPLIADEVPAEGAGYFVVSFERTGGSEPAPPDGPPGGPESAEELRRLRTELQGTIEDLQVSNEELKASHEEVVSVVEEYQSANEELETSKEEMQSLNEELTTVNAQLRAKMEELQSTSGDLASLLASTDIAVLFLDRGFRIRRYTAAIRGLMDLIAGDVGRPLAALSRRFDDPELDGDARAVLDRLAPIEREISGDDGRHYLRRALPYRTLDNRIDGVVVTFVDITARLRAEAATRAIEEARAFLLRLGNALRPLVEPAAIQAEASRLLREHLDVGWCYYNDFDDAGTVATVLRDATRPGLLPVVGVHDLAGTPQFTDHLRSGRAFNAPDLAAPSHFDRRIADRFAALGMRSVLGMPLVKDGRLIAALLVADTVPRDWPEATVMLLAEVVERTWAAIERVGAEGALRETKARYRALLDSTDEGYCILQMIYDEDGVAADFRFLQVNQAFERHRGFLGAGGPTIREAVPEIEPKWLAAYDRVARTGEPLRLEEDSATSGRTYSLYAFPIDEPRERKVAVIFADITARRRAELDAKESGELFRLLVENVSDHAIFFMDPGGLVAGWWEGAERLLGYPAGEVLGRPGGIFYGPGGKFERELREATETGRSTDEGWLIRKDGTRFWASGAVTALREPSGELRGFVKIFRDQTESRKAEADVREARDRLRIALEAARMGIWLWDAEGDAHASDANLNRLLGREAVETRRTLEGFLESVHPEDRDFVRATFDATVRRGRPLNIEFRVVWPDGTVRWLRDQGDISGGPEGGPARLAGACVDVTDLKEAEAALLGSRDELEGRVAERTEELARANLALRAGLDDRTELLRRIVTAQEDERRRVARDLHDGLGQEITALILGLGALERAVPDGSPGRERLGEVEATVARIGREAHDLAIDIRPTALDDLGLIAALSAYIDRWSGRTGIAAEFQPTGVVAGDRFPPEVETTAYRIVQEALNNVAKYAMARRVSVILERQGDELTALVEDDGRGFDPARPGPAGRRSLGLLGMRERVNLVGGTLLIESGDGVGTTVRARIPLGMAAEGPGDGR